jgi:hypothetical protein
MPPNFLQAAAMTAIFLLASAPAFASPPVPRSCEVRPGCKVQVHERASCTEIVGWMGQCSGGFAQGLGSLHFMRGTAIVSRYSQGQPTGELVWHENGMPAQLGGYDTRLMSIDAKGEVHPLVVDCSWDYERNEVKSSQRGDDRCERSASLLGHAAFSPLIWRSFAKAMLDEMAARKAPAAAAPRITSTPVPTSNVRRERREDVE